MRMIRLAMILVGSGERKDPIATRLGTTRSVSESVCLSVFWEYAMTYPLLHLRP